MVVPWRLCRGALSATVVCLLFSSCGPVEHVSSADGGHEEGPVFYSYKSDSGRLVFVNDINLIPSDKRPIADALDVSHVDLQHEYAASFARAVDEEIEEIRESSSCETAKTERTLGTAARVWHRHGPWIIASFACLFLVFLTPMMSRWLPGGQWSRFIMMAFPVIFFVTVMAITATRANDSLSSVDELAGLCEPDGEAVPEEAGREPGRPALEDELEKLAEPTGEVKSRVGELQRMRKLITELYANRAAQIDAVLNE